MAAVVSDFLGHFVVGLIEEDDAPFAVPPVDEIVNDTVLVAFRTIIWNFHSPYRYTTITMSVKKWRQQTEEKDELYDQEEQIPSNSKRTKETKSLASLREKGF